MILQQQALSSVSSFRVALEDRYYGPLDLLLYLLRQQELDVHDIAIARIAEQFQQFLATLQELHLLRLEIAGEFLLMASRLMEMKSRLLLPEQAEIREGEEGSVRLEDSPRHLVDQLLEYKKIKEAVAALEQQAFTSHVRYPRVKERLPDESPTVLPRLRPIELWDLVAAFARILREVQLQEHLPLQVDEVPQQVYEQEVIRRLEQVERLPFTQLFTPPYLRPRLIGLFLALLELIRRLEVVLEHDDQGLIWLAKNHREPLRSREARLVTQTTAEQEPPAATDNPAADYDVSRSSDHT